MSLCGHVFCGPPVCVIWSLQAALTCGAGVWWEFVEAVLVTHSSFSHSGFPRDCGYCVPTTQVPRHCILSSSITWITVETKERREREPPCPAHIRDNVLTLQNSCCTILLCYVCVNNIHICETADSCHTFHSGEYFSG